MLRRITAMNYGSDPEADELYSFTPGYSLGIMLNFSSIDLENFDVEVISSVVSEDMEHLGEILEYIGINLQEYEYEELEDE